MKTHCATIKGRMLSKTPGPLEHAIAMQVMETLHHSERMTFFHNASDSCLVETIDFPKGNTLTKSLIDRVCNHLKTLFVLYALGTGLISIYNPGVTLDALKGIIITAETWKFVKVSANYKKKHFFFYLNNIYIEE